MHRDRIDFGYAAEKLGSAVHTLMLPHRDEATAIMMAFHELTLGVGQTADLGNEEANRWRRRLYELMDTSGMPDTPENRRRGLAVIRAEQLTFDERGEFSRCMWELENYVRDRFFEKGR